MAKEPEQTCGNCRFQRYKSCHRYPRQVYFDPRVGGSGATWELPPALGWCGEWKSQPPVPGDDHE